MNFKTIWVGILGLFGMGPLAVVPTSRYGFKPKTPHKSVRNQTIQDRVRIEEAKQKRMRKQSNRLSIEIAKEG